MKILGIDPGTIVLGYGIIEARGEDIILITSSTLNCNKGSPMGERLNYLYQNIRCIIKRYRPESVAIEQPFVAKNASSALAIGKAQAVAILAAASKNVPTYEYTPRQIKQQVTGHGGSDKEQVKEMVRIQLNLEQAPHPVDATDALAVAICHARETHLKGILNEE